MAERFLHLERMVSSNDAAQQAESRAVARWIGNFLDPDAGIEASLRAAHSSLTRKTTTTEDEPRAYMEQDSSSNVAD